MVARTNFRRRVYFGILSLFLNKVNGFFQNLTGTQFPFYKGGIVRLPAIPFLKQQTINGRLYSLPFVPIVLNAYTKALTKSSINKGKKGSKQSTYPAESLSHNS